MSQPIGILTSGGDCPGLNAAIRATALRLTGGHGRTAIGIENGTQGLLERPVAHRTFDPEVSDAAPLREAGTVLGTTNKGDPFAWPLPDGGHRDRSDEIVEGLRTLGVEALVGIGGDGSLRILRKLAEIGGFGLVGVPKTIDNDVGLTEVSIGFDTAMRVATAALDSLQPTAASHSRVMILEVMGRDAGHIALASGIAGGADVILIPEIDYDLATVAAKIDRVRAGGRNFALAVIAEGVRDLAGNRIKTVHPGGYETLGGIGEHLAGRIAEATGAETRVTVLGHLQRGAPPSPRDRLIASAFGTHAADLAAAGKFDRMVAWRERAVVDVPLEQAIAAPHNVDPAGTLVRTARGLGICLGDG